ncbi:MAG: hypothetical protein AABZ12_10865 [Planctomycetota bacterium]
MMIRRLIRFAFVFVVFVVPTATFAGGLCSTDADCNDNNPCTQDDCIGIPPFGTCAHFPLSGNACADDGNTCTNDVCTSGVCTHPGKAAGTACGSSANNDCTKPDTCNGSGACLPNHLANGTECLTDNNPCTGDTCSNGICTHPTKPAGTACPDDGNTCTNDVCSNILCTHPNKTSGSACSDGDQCTSPDVCDGNGSCTGTPIPDCGGCPIGLALNGVTQREPILQTLRQYRDDVLAGSEIGRDYTDLYYYHADELSAILLAKPELRLQAVVEVVRLLPDVQGVVGGQTVQLSNEDMQAIDHLLASIQREAGDELAEDIQNLRSALQKGALPDVLGVKVEAQRTGRR